MSSPAARWNGWRGVALIAITYVYFLIFAQFAFLKRLAQLGIADDHLKLVMAAMAVGGIALSLLASRRLFGRSPRLQLQAGLFLCAAAALLSLRPLSLAGSVAVSLLIGSGLGVLTVTLVSRLDLWIGSEASDGAALLKVGLGTGLGYFLCNVPALFTAPPQRQALVAACLCLLGIFVCAREAATSDAVNVSLLRRSPFVLVLVAFTALIWLDSAAFFIIQSTPALKAGTWQGTLHLWTNGTLHLAAALVAAWLLRRRGLAFVLAAAILCLASACLLLLDPHRVVLASLFYPIGVSLYSVALVAYPSLLLSGTLTERSRRAGVIYAVAGWIGSAMGIGMAQNLGHVPILFVAAACAFVLGPPATTLLRSHWREAATLGILMLVALLGRLTLLGTRPDAEANSVERGKAVYVSEGCIHCHSQYVRPATRGDVLMWGPTRTVEELHAERPPLIGNRRQGPDLSEIGTRRSPLWLKAHFYNPRDISYGSFMPSYALLFQPGDPRGDDLVAYLGSLHTPGVQQHLTQEREWQPVAEQASASEGASLFVQGCATCHSPGGATRQRWHDEFNHLPTDLVNGPWHDLPPSDHTGRLAQIIKFGIPGTDMPGHEYFSDDQVVSLVLWLRSTTVADARFEPRLNTQHP
jgi:mono/diheme cytochrome c family protein